jgi:hypothetical protein
MPSSLEIHFFIGDVGRPDLAVKSDLTQEDLAGYYMKVSKQNFDFA